MATTPTPPAKTASGPDMTAFKACVAGGGAITIKDNGDGTFQETCTLNHKSVPGPTKTKTSPANTNTDNKSKPAPFQKAKAEMEQAIAATKLNKVSIISDGTKDGTKILINGQAVPNLTSLSFRFYNDGYCGPVGLDYTVKDPSPKPGDLYSYTTYCFKPHDMNSAYANNKVVAATDESGVFEFKRTANDTLGRSAPSPGRTGYANAFNGTMNK